MTIELICVIILISLFAILSLLPGAIKLSNEREKAKNDFREKLIESEAQIIMTRLQNLYGDDYPEELPLEIYNLLDFPDLVEYDVSKEYFGETIGIEDFTYTGYGTSFRLCIKPSLGGKCWEN